MKDPIDIISSKISSRIKKMNSDETGDEDVLFFSLSLAINNILTILFVFIIATMTNTVILTFIAFVFFAALRWTAEGYHFKSLSLCVIVTTALIAPMPLIPLPQIAFIPCAMICTLSLLFKANVSPKMITVSIAIVWLGLLFQESYIILACLAQTITLFPKRG